MKPKTRFQKLIVSLSDKIPEITENQKEWAFKHCFDHYAYYTKSKGAMCMECGNSFQASDPELLINLVIKQKVKCPHCGSDVHVTKTKKRKMTLFSKMALLTTCEGIQVIRIFDVRQDYYKGTMANYDISEIIRHWVDKKGRWDTFAKLRSNNFGYGIFSWSWGSDQELRTCKPHHNMSSYEVYPHSRYIPEIRRDGFKGECYGLSHLDLFIELLSNPKIETILKSNQTDLLRYLVSKSNTKLETEYLWPSIKICIRKNYYIKDPILWSDYISLLRYFGKDLTNAHYVCPISLNKEHDRLVSKKREIERKVSIEKKKKEAALQEAEFKRIKEKFFGLEFEDDLIKIVALNSVDEHLKEGDLLHHCVFTNNYHLKADSLILSARIDNIPIETIEVSLKYYKIIQCRGAWNRSSEYHDRIIDLVNKNIQQIRKRTKQKQTA